MTIIRTIADLARLDVRRIKRGRYEILAIERNPWRSGTDPLLVCRGAMLLAASDRKDQTTILRGSGGSLDQRRVLIHGTQTDIGSL